MSPPSLADDLRTAQTTIRPFRTDPLKPGALRRAAERAKVAPWRLVTVTDPDMRRAIRDAHLPHWRAHLADSGGARILAADAPARTARDLRAADRFAHELHEAPVHLVLLRRRRGGTVRDAALGDLADGLRAEGFDAAPVPFAGRAAGVIAELLALDDELEVHGVLVARPRR